MENLNLNRSKLDEDQAVLNRYNNELRSIEETCNNLKEQAEESQRFKEKTQQNLELNQMRMNRSKILLVGLKDEQIRWKNEVENLLNQKEFLIGDTLIAAGSLC